MGKLKFIFKRLGDMDFKGLFRTVESTHKKSKKCRIYLFFDIIYCGFRYGAGYSDYEMYEFYDLPASLRETYIVRTTNNLIIAHCNKKDYYHFIHDKIEFNTRYSDYLGRDWLDFRSASKEDFERFIDGKTAVIAKPVDATCGIGVRKLKTADYSSPEAMYEALRALPEAQLLEDCIVQHHELSGIYPYSVNTVRVVTLLRDETVHVMFAILRIGNNGSVVDNFTSGGFCAPVDVETGEIQYSGYDKSGKQYDVHPATGHMIKGFTVPYWKEVVEMCRKASFVTPEIRYMGWDVAITENGPVFVEGNHMPGYNLMQLPFHNPSRVGKKPVYREVLKGEFEL